MSPASTFQPKDWSNIIKISVGPEEQLFEVHKHVLDTIPFFHACLNSAFQESLNKTVQMPEDDVKSFNEIVQYAYSGQLSSNLTLTLSPKTSNLDSDERLHVLRQTKVNLCLLLTTYTLARKLGMEELPNKIMDTIDQYKKDMPGLGEAELSYVFENLQVENILRAYLLQQFACRIRKVGWNTWKNKHPRLHKRFFQNNTSNVEEVLEIASQPKLIAPSLEKGMKPCKWHVHVCSSSAGSRCPSPKARDSLEEGIKALRDLAEATFLQAGS